VTKKQLIQLLQMIYDGIPECSCTDDYTDRNLRDPGCMRHYMYTEGQIKYIRMALNNETIQSSATYHEDPTYP
jgi:hypothetical protein